MWKVCSTLLIYLIFSMYVAKSISSAETLPPEFFYVKSAICRIEERLQFGCSWVEPLGFPEGDVTNIDCSRKCNEYEQCIGSTRDKYGQCILHKKCLIPLPCASETIQSTVHTYWENYCIHGYWNSQLKQCSCIKGCHGKRCEMYPISCSVLNTDPYFSAGFHFVIIDPLQDGKRPFEVYCTATKTRVWRNSGGEIFNKTWLEYVYGFHQGPENYWVGLYPLHILTNIIEQRYLVVALQFEFNGQLPKPHVAYPGFIVDSEENGFKFSFSHHIVNAPISGPAPKESLVYDCLGPVKNTPFSTFDMDNDQLNDTNCASQASFGWWFKDDNLPCNALGWKMENYANSSTYQRLTVVGTDFTQQTVRDHLDFFGAYIIF